MTTCDYDINSLRPSWVSKINAAHVQDLVPFDCWLWQGSRNKPHGYGRVTVNYRNLYLHRVIYELLVGPIPEGLHIDHLCRQPSCCNPCHLEAVTCLVNVRRGVKASKTHCRREHPLSGDNVYVYTSKKGVHRRCRTCRAAYMEKWIAERAERKRQTWAKYWPTEDAA